MKSMQVLAFISNSSVLDGDQHLSEVLSVLVGACDTAATPQLWHVVTARAFAESFMSSQPAVTQRTCTALWLVAVLTPCGALSLLLAHVLCWGPHTGCAST
jgi:hypothetical protein